MKINKILIFADPESDYGQYMIWLGLVRLFGDENVVTYPYKKTYYGEVANDYILPDGKQGFTSPCDFYKTRPVKPHIWTTDEIVEHISEFNLIIIGSLRKYALLGYKEIRDRISGFRGPVVYTDFEDYSGMNMWQIDEIKPDVLFKREMLMGEPYPSHYPIHPLPFSCFIEPQEFKPAEKDIDVFFAAGITHPVRQQIIDKLRTLKIRFVGGGNEFRRSWQEYNELMERSKISIVARGWGWDSVRAWEAPAHNTMVMWLNHPQILPNPFTDREHIVNFNLNNLEELVYYYLDNEKERLQIQEAGRNHLWNFHTCEKRAQYMLDCIDKLGGL